MGRAKSWFIALLGLGCVAGATSGCNAIFGLDEKSLAPDGGSGSGMTSTSGSGSGMSSTSGCTQDDAGYSELQNSACWLTFTVGIGLDGNPAYAGGTFDGRYVYFVSNVDGLILRYDTTIGFSDSLSWLTFDTEDVPNVSTDTSLPYAGAVFDGRYVYAVPNYPNMSFVRYDTTLPFSEAASWSAFTPTPNATAYSGGTFDGRYVYYAPLDGAPGDDAPSAVARYDTKGDFTQRTSWSTFDTTSVNVSANTFNGAVYDGRYVYLAPSEDQTDSDGSETNVVARFDTQGIFVAAASWDVFDMGNLPGSPEVGGFVGGIYDGSYVYFAPQTSSAAVLRLDPMGTFTSASAWSAYDPEPNLGEIGIGSSLLFAAGAFDGRHLYFVPTETEDLGNNGLIVQHDLSGGFSTASSWSTFDTTHVHASSFGAGVFDGRYLYLPPGVDSEGIAARFEARQTSSQPNLPDYHGSFF